MRASILLSTCVSQEQVLLIRLEKYVSVLSQMPLKNMIVQKSSWKSLMSHSGSCPRTIYSMFPPFWPLICSARSITSCLISNNVMMFLPAWLNLCTTFSLISAAIFSTLSLVLSVRLSMQSLMAILALSETMLEMCLLFTKSDLWMLGMMSFSNSVGSKGLSLSFLRGCLNSFTRLLSIRQFRKACYSSVNRQPRSFLSSLIFLISALYLSMPRSRSARLMIRITPYLISLNDLKDRSRFLVSLGSLSALVSEMWDSSIISTIFTLLQMSSSLCTKNELEISYYSPLLSLKPGQSQKARFSITVLVGMEVSEYFSWPILMLVSPSTTSLGLSPCTRTQSWLPARKFMMVLLPTPVSPMTMMASAAFSSLGMAEMPFLIRSLSLSRLRGVSLGCIVINIIVIVGFSVRLACATSDQSASLQKGQMSPGCEGVPSGH